MTSVVVFFIEKCLKDSRVRVGSAVRNLDELPGKLQAVLVKYYNNDGNIKIHFPLDRNPPAGSAELVRNTQFYEYVTLDGRRITPTSRTRRSTAGSSIVQAQWKDQHRVGEVVSIFHHVQAGSEDVILFAEMRWMTKSNASATRAEDDPWDEL